MTQPSLEKGVNILREQIDGPVAAFFSSCIHCGMCAEACLFYTETGEPKYTPIHKLEPMRRLWEREFTFAGRIKKWLGLDWLRRLATKNSNSGSLSFTTAAPCAGVAAWSARLVTTLPT